MPFTDTQPAIVGNAAKLTCKISASRRVAAPSSIRFSMNKPFMDYYFAGVKKDTLFKIRVGEGSDKGLVILTKHEEGNIKLAVTPKGAGALIVTAWAGVKKAKFTAQLCEVKMQNEQGLVIKTPHLADLG